jgi:ABC-2 type transport system permease protein
MIRTGLAFIKKDFLIQISYKFNFILQIAFIFMAVALFYYIGKFADTGAIPLLQQYGGSYFGFLLIGVAFAHYMTVSIHSFANNIRDGQLTGTLEFILISPNRLSTFLIASSLWSFLFTTFIIILYLLFGVFLFDLSIGDANLPAALIILALSIISFVAIGIIFASVVLVFKKGDSVFTALGGLGLIISGLVFPLEVLPSSMRNIADFIPTTYSMHGLRLAILKGSPINSLTNDIIALVFFAALFLSISILVFPLAVRISKIKGTLTQY